MKITIETEDVRAALMDYYGTAMTGGFPMAVVSLGDIERASAPELVRMARDAGFDLRDFQVDDDDGDDQ